MSPSDNRPPAELDPALTLIQTTASAVAGRVAETLGAAAQGSTRISERDLLTSSQFELRRNLGTFHLVFGEALRERVQQELTPRGTARRKPGHDDWQSLSLVDDHEVEERLFADRIGQTIAHECEAELRELSTYVGSVLNTRRADADHNPLRAEVLGGALYRAIEAVSEQAETRKILARDIGQAMARAMPACYTQIIEELQARGVQPMGLTMRGTEGPGNMLPGLNSAYAGLSSTRGSGAEFDVDTGPGGYDGGTGSHDRHTAAGPDRYGGASRGNAGSGRAGQNPPTSSHGYSEGRGPGASTAPSSLPTSSLGSGWQRGGSHHAAAARADAQLMTLLRRLTALASGPAPLDAVPPFTRGADAGHGAGRRTGIGAGAADTPTGSAHAVSGLSGLMAVNLIRAHRDELLQASTGKLDHMVIDVVGSLFDQILSDSRVPPQMARQIARLQLPVLRVALNDASFFSSRRHPVRRFVNRIASLACAFDDFDDGPGKELLGRVRELVEEIVDGDFDQIETYTDKLAELERFTAEQTDAEVQKTGAAATLDSKETELRVQQRYMMQLQAALTATPLPPYLREFLSQVWSQALVLASRRDGPQSERTQRYRRVGRDLVMSVQPKGSPMLRKKFLMQLPPLMKDLNEGMQYVGWPQAAQRDFFAKLLPGHAESLKGQPLSELDYNLMAKQLETVFAAPLPTAEMLSSADWQPPVDDALIATRFSAEEAQRVGFVAETAVDWSGEVDIDLDAEAATVPGVLAGHAERAAAAAEMVQMSDATPIDLGVDIHLDVGAAEPSRGPQLIDHIKLGFAYQMHLKDAWQKVRLTHVSAGRSFFVFTRGQKHQETISMTSRMLARMCETGRLRATESAYLMERATQRARKQLAALKSSIRH